MSGGGAIRVLLQPQPQPLPTITARLFAVGVKRDLYETGPRRERPVATVCRNRVRMKKIRGFSKGRVSLFDSSD